MTLEENTPGKSHDLAPLSNLAAEVVVQIPDEEPAKEHAQSVPDHKPHRFESLHVTDVLVVLVFSGRNRQALLFASHAVFFARTPPFRTKRHLHCIHTSQDHDGSQDRVCILVEHGVLQVVVIESDENGQRSQGNSQNHTDARWSRVGKGRIAHQARGINHGELINQLHRI